MKAAGTWCLRLALASVLAASAVRAGDTGSNRWLMATATVVPEYTAPEGEGYFSIVEGHNGRLYIGTHANALNAWLVEFDPSSNAMCVVVDAHAAIGTSVTGFAAQAKIHTRNNVGASGKIYFGTKQGYPAKGESRTNYPGGYPMAYDPSTGATTVYPIPVPQQGVISVTPDESRGLAYVSTCSDERPLESAHFLVLDLETRRYRDLLDTHHVYAFIVVDDRGRAYHPVRGGTIARYDPATKNVDILEQTIDGRPPSADSLLADPDGRHPINWDISPDGRTLYAQPMKGNVLYAYDLTGNGKVLAGRRVGVLLSGAESIDCRAMCVGPSGAVWCAVTTRADGINRLHLVRYRPGDKAPVDLGPVAVANRDFAELTDENGKTRRYHGGFVEHADGVLTTRYVILGVCESRAGDVYILALQPYAVLRVPRAVLD